MSSQSRQQRWYASLFIYKIYRRIKFVRYKRKLKKNIQLEIRRQDELERKKTQAQIREFKLSEKQRHRIKLKKDREEARILKNELRQEFKSSANQAKQEWKKLAKEDILKAKKEKLALKRERRKQFWLNLNDLLRNFIYSFRSINKESVKRKIENFRNDAHKRRRFAIISINSTILFLLAYFCLFLLSQATTVITAGFFDYPTTVYYYEIYFNISQESWFHDSVQTIFSSGPLVNFIIGIIFIIIYNNIKESPGPFKLFFLWGFMHAVNMLFGALLVGTLFETGVGHVISWMYIMDTGRVLYSTISVFLLVVAGILVTKQFLISGNTYYNEINKANRTSFVVAQVLMPYILGNIFLLFLRQPRFVFYDTFTVVALILCIIPILATYRSFNDLYFEEEEKKPSLVWISLLILALVVFFFRGVLENGLRFG